MKTDRRFLLGLDLGVASLGWALMPLDEEGNPSDVAAMGTRVWEIPNAQQHEIESGSEKPAGQERREKRQQRRQIFRRAQRLRRTFRVLQEMALLPSRGGGFANRGDVLAEIDAAARAWLRQNRLLSDDRLGEHTFLYALRAAALDRELPRELLGRVFYHLAQRRGFLNNRKTDKADDDERGKVKAAIGELNRRMEESGARSLGEFLARLNPHEERIRGRWTSRRMFLEEFALIWEKQKTFHPEWKAEDEERLRQAIFYQRPLKSQRSRIGECTLEPRRRRAPMGCLEAQRIRYVQWINDLELIDPAGHRRELTDDERKRLYDLAENSRELSFRRIFAALKLPGQYGEDGWSFNFAQGGERNLKGNATAAALWKVLGKRWDDLPSERKKQLTDELLSYQKDEALLRRLTGPGWNFDGDTAKRLASVTFEKGYHAFSRRAIRKLLPLLERGERLNHAISQIYPQRAIPAEGCDSLPPVLAALPEVRNPVVIRALTELRKVVNRLIRTYGKPEMIRLELARDLKRPRKERERISKRNREQERLRERARQDAERVLSREATATNILKVLLAEECGCRCPYTGKEISMTALLGDEPQFQIEHIFPFRRTLDDSFANKTLCYHEENLRKGDRTPYEAYGSDPERWKEIIQRVKRFNGPFAAAKLHRFLAKELPEDFAERHLNDTRYASKLAARYLGMLYGGVVDANRKRRVMAVAGTLTAFLRQVWNLNSVLGDPSSKTRADHRHHAVDALVVAVTDASIVQRASRLSQQSGGLRPYRWRMAPPWGADLAGFIHSVKQAVDRIVTSHRKSLRLSGALHQESLYSPPVERNKKMLTKMRIPLERLTKDRVEDIVDDRVRELVEQALKQAGSSDPKAVFSNPAHLPRIRGRNGTETPVKSVRVWVAQNVVPVGADARRRYVIPGQNHHLEIYARLDEEGREIKWEGRIVSLLEAVRRHRHGEPVICKDHGPGTQFKFALAKNDYIEWQDQGRWVLLRVAAISDNHLEFRLPNDARPATVVRRERNRIRGGYKILFEREARKVSVDPLGQIRPAHE